MKKEQIINRAGNGEALCYFTKPEWISDSLPTLYFFLHSIQDHPIRNYAEHSREVFSLNWNNIRKELFASGSWDGSVKIVSVVLGLLLFLKRLSF